MRSARALAAASVRAAKGLKLLGGGTWDLGRSAVFFRSGRCAPGLSVSPGAVGAGGGACAAVWRQPYSYGSACGGALGAHLWH